MTYDYFNCPDEPDTGGIPQCGQHPECTKCIWYKIVMTDEIATNIEGR